jgi:hypothetical protein
MRAGKKERNKWALGCAGKKEKGGASRAAQGKEMGQKKRFGP